VRTEDEHPMVVQRLRTNSGSVRSGKRYPTRDSLLPCSTRINRVMLMLDISASSALGRPCAMTEERYAFSSGGGI
jgi:hypothetical protein